MHSEGEERIMKNETNHSILELISLADEKIVAKVNEYGIYEYNEIKLSRYADIPLEIDRAAFYVRQVAYRKNIDRARRIFTDEVIINLTEKFKSGDKLSDKDQAVICTILHRLIRCGQQLDAITFIESNQSFIAATENRKIFSDFVKRMIYESLFKYWDRVYCIRWYKLYMNCFSSEEENALTSVENINSFIVEFLKHLRGGQAQLGKLYSRKMGKKQSRLYMLGMFDSYYQTKFDSIRSSSKKLTLTDCMTAAIEISDSLESESFPELLVSVWYLFQCIVDDLGTEIILNMENSDNAKEEVFIWLNKFLFEKNISIPSGIKRYLDAKKGLVSCEEIPNLIAIAKIYSYVDRVKKLLRTDPPNNLMYYTTYETLLYMMPHALSDIKKTEIALETEKLVNSGANSCAMWAFMNVGYMNDPNEGKAARTYFNILPNFDNNSDDNRVTYSDVYLKSFTSRRDDLSMWEMYGDHAEGCFVSVNWAKTKKNNSDKKIPFVYKVLYMTASGDGKTFSFAKEKNEHISKDNLDKINELMVSIKETIDGETDENIKVSMLLATERIWYLIKDSSYWHEAENRILFDERDSGYKLKYTGGDIPKVYLQGEFRLYFDEIMFGPKCKNVIEKTIFLDKQFAEILAAYGIEKPAINVSSIHYR